MIPLELDWAEKKALVATLAVEHRVSSRFEIMTREHRPVGSLTGRATSGQVNIDTTADVSRSLQLEIVDPVGVSGVDREDGSARLDRMIQAEYGVYVERPIYDWVWLPVFCGPITTTSRAEGLVTIDASGKESITRGPAFYPRSWRKGLTKIGVIRSMMEEMGGEDRFDLPHDWKATLPKDLNLGRQSSPWTHTIILCRSMNAHAYYDGRGTLRIRKRPSRPVYTFTTGAGGTIITPPGASESTSELVNMVTVKGSGDIVATAFLPRAHPYSPHSLGRNGRPDYLPLEIEDDSIRTKKEAQEVADKRVSEAQIDEQEVTFTSLPVPFLEELDPFAIDTPGLATTTRLQKMSLAFGHEGVSTIGYTAPISSRRR